MKLNVKNMAIGLLITGALSGGYMGLDAIAGYYAQFPDTIMKVQSSVPKEATEKMEFPQEIEMYYALPKSSPLLEEGYAYGISGGGDDFWEVSVLKKTSDGYIIEMGDDKEFLVEDPKQFGFKGIIEPHKQNGSFKMTFPTQNQFESFLDAFDGNGKWQDAFLYMKEAKEGKKHEE